MVGKTAPPTIAITINDEPAFVNLPKSVIASGHNAGHINEHPRAINSTKKIEIFSGIRTTINEPKIAIDATIRNAIA